MAGLSVNIGGDASGAIAAVAAAEAAIAGLTGRRTCVIDVQVNGVKEASAQLADLAKARDSLSRPIDIGVSGGDQLKDASKNLRALNNQMDRAGQLGDGMRDLGGRFDGLSSSVASFGQSSEQASTSMGQVNRQFGALNRNVARSAELGADMDRVTDRVGSLGASLGGFGGGASRGVGGGVRVATDAVNGLGRGVSGLPGLIGPATGALSAFMKASAYSAVGSGLLTAGVGALGAGSALAVGGGAGLLGLAGGALTGGVLDLLEDKKSDPPTRLGQQLARVGAQAKQLARDAVEPYGDSLVAIADQGLAAATPNAVAPVREAFAQIGQIAQQGAPQVGAAIGLVAGAFSRLTAGGGGQAFREMFENLPAVTAAVIDPLEQMTNTLGAVADQAAGSGVPAFARLTNSAGQFGSTILGIGAANMAGFLNDTASMVDGVDEMASRLQGGGAIGSSMSAVTSVVNAVSGGIGDATRETKEFADTVTGNAGPIRQAVGGAIKGMTGLGEAGVDGLAKSAPAIDRAGQAVQDNKGGLGNITGTVGTNVSNFVGDLTRVAGAFGSLLPDPAAIEASNQELSAKYNKPAAQTPEGAALMGAQMGLSPAGGAMGGMLGTGPQVGLSQPPAPLPQGTLPQAFQTAPQMGPSPLSPAAQSGGAAPNLPGLGMLQNLQQIQGAAGQAGQAVQGMGQQMSGATQVPQQQMQQMTQQMGQVPPAAQQMVQGTQQATQAFSMAPSMQAQTQQLATNIVSQAGAVESAGGSLGAAMNTGMAEGYTKTETVIDTIIRKHILRIIDIPATELDSHSPSRVFARFGESMPTGLAVGVAAKAGDSISSVTGMMNDTIATAESSAGGSRTKAVGETWAQNVLNGATAVFQTDQLKALSAPQMDNRLAKAKLGSLGALGPAGAGALVAKTFQPSNRTIGGGAGGAQQIVIKGAPVVMDGKVVAQIADQRVMVRLGEVVDSYSRQSG